MNRFRPEGVSPPSARETEFLDLLSRKPLDPEVTLVTLKYQGALIARLTLALGRPKVDEVFDEVARTDLPDRPERFRAPVVDGLLDVLRGSDDMDLARGAQSQILRALCRKLERGRYADCCREVIESFLGTADRRAKLDSLRDSLQATRALGVDPSAAMPGPPEHLPFTAYCAAIGNRVDF